MKFTVKFSSSNPDSNYAAALPKESGGIKLLDAARTYTNVEKLDIRLVDNLVPEFYTNPTIPISETLARESNLFLEKNYAVVEVPNSFLNKYAFFMSKIERSEETGEILSVGFHRMLDEEGIIEDWKAAGYPSKWGLED